MDSAASMTDSKIVQIVSHAPDPATISSACEILKNGGLVVAPTETRYGLIAGIDRPDAIEKLFDAKGRVKAKPSAIFVPSITILKSLADVSKTAEKLADKFLPGPLTLVLRAKKDFGPFFSQNGLTGFRISSSAVISAIHKQCRFQLSATSANLSGAAEPDTIPAIREQLGEKIDLYLDSGRLNNPASTVVSVIDDEIKILRAGAITESAIRKALK